MLGLPGYGDGFDLLAPELHQVRHGGDLHGTKNYPFASLASAQLEPQVTLMVSGTRRSAAPLMASATAASAASVSSGGTSSITSSCTCSTNRLVNEAAATRVSRRTRAT